MVESTTSTKFPEPSQRRDTVCTESSQRRDTIVSFDFGQPKKQLEDKATKTENAILNVVELNDVQSDELLQVQKWANRLSQAHLLHEIDAVTDEMKRHYGKNLPQPDQLSIKSEDSLDSPEIPRQESYEIMVEHSSPSSVSSSSISLLPDSILTRY
jgi:hypothetical protein